MSAYTFDVPSYDPFDDLPDPERKLPHVPQDIGKPTSLNNVDATSSRTITLRMPSQLLDRVDDLAAKESTSRSHVIRRITALVLDSICRDPDAVQEYSQQISRLYDQAKRIIQSEGRATISMLQAHLRIDYDLAILLLAELEHNGVVTAPDEDGKRIPMLQHLMKQAAAHSRRSEFENQLWLDRNP